MSAAEASSPVAVSSGWVREVASGHDRDNQTSQTDARQGDATAPTSAESLLGLAGGYRRNQERSGSSMPGSSIGPNHQASAASWSHPASGTYRLQPSQVHNVPVSHARDVQHKAAPVSTPPYQAARLPSGPSSPEVPESTAPHPQQQYSSRIAVRPENCMEPQSSHPAISYGEICGRSDSEDETPSTAGSGTRESVHQRDPPCKASGLGIEGIEVLGLIACPCCR